MGSAKDKLVCVGVICGVHGVKGAVVIKPFTQEPGNVAAYGPVCFASGGARLVLHVTGRKKNGLIVSIEGVNDRNKAETLKGEKLFVERSKLPELEDESWYMTDLAGLDVVDPSGALLGLVIAVQNYGAGDLLEIRPPGKGKATVFLPFTKAAVPKVDIENRQIVADPPQGWIEDKED